MTSTWIQFPCLQLSPRWAVLVINMERLLEHFLNRKFMCLKGLKLCSCLQVRNAFTSDNLYDVQSLPRSMAFFLPKVPPPS